MYFQPYQYLYDNIKPTADSMTEKKDIAGIDDLARHVCKIVEEVCPNYVEQVNDVDTVLETGAGNCRVHTAIATAATNALVDKYDLPVRAMPLVRYGHEFLGLFASPNLTRIIGNTENASAYVGDSSHHIISNGLMAAAANGGEGCITFGTTDATTGLTLVSRLLKQADLPELSFDSLVCFGGQRAASNHINNLFAANCGYVIEEYSPGRYLPRFS